MGKPRLGFWQVWNMSFGFLGIQFGWGLQMANMSAIYNQLGAKADDIPMLWLAAPMTGLLVQPIIGAMSDRTWGRLGRRRPYFLVGAIMSSIALVLMPNSSALWMAAGLLWVLDASINVSMEPFRAFVADKLPDEQRTSGFAMQSLFIGLGAVIASGLPWLLTNVVNYRGDSVKFAFYVGAAAFLGAVLWTVLTTDEYPPEDLAAFRRERAAAGGWLASVIRALREMLREIGAALGTMPPVMRRLAPVQMATWLGLFLMWFYFVPATARYVFGGGEDANSPAYKAGQEWGGICFMVYSGVCFAFAFAIAPMAARLGRRVVHSAALAIGGVGLLSLFVIVPTGNKYALFVPMVCIGIAWASIVSMPYAMLSGSLPAGRMGVYMGIFNFFIVVPEIIASLTFGPIMRELLGNNEVYGVMVGGGFLLLASALVWRLERRSVEYEAPVAAPAPAAKAAARARASGGKKTRRRPA
jgi:maltose/moltooligosaccharide transporter